VVKSMTPSMVPTLVKSMVELQDMDPDMTAFAAECEAHDVCWEKKHAAECTAREARSQMDQVNQMPKLTEELEAADSGKAHQVNKTGVLKQDKQERAHRARKHEEATMFDKAESFSDVQPKRARDTCALSPIHCHQSHQLNAGVLDSSHVCSQPAPRTSSCPSRDTRALSTLRPQFGTSNKVVPVYSHVLAEIDSVTSMTTTTHALLICETQQNMSMKMADGSVLNSNMLKKGFLDATCNGKLLTNIEALHVPDLAATLISSPQLVSEGNMDMVHLKR